MKGLDLAEKYFNTYGLPLIRERFGGYADKMAAGLVGDGSECFGFDDALSQDHDWGPGFCLWLDDTDYAAMGMELEQALSTLPKTFLGHGPRKVSNWGFGRIGVFRISGFYRQYTGLDRLPESLDDWLAIPENSLAACTNGAVFYDPYGMFSQWRKHLSAFYPEDVRLKKIASRCMSLAQFGQYNFSRCVKRQAYFPAQYAQTKFCADALSMVFLLNKRYAPFFKWMHRAVADLPILGRSCYTAVAGLVNTADYDAKAQMIERMAQAIIGELKKQGLSDSRSSFLLDHGPQVQEKIADENLRQRNVWVG